MKRAAILEHLAKAEQHVTLSERHVRDQQALVERLERDGSDTVMARLLLAEYEHSLALHRMDLTRIRTELYTLPDG
jgi:hypothetical protein